MGNGYEERGERKYDVKEKTSVRRSVSWGGPVGRRREERHETEIIVYPTIRKPEGEGASEINKLVGDETRLAPPLHIIERRGGGKTQVTRDTLTTTTLNQFSVLLGA